MALEFHGLWVPRPGSRNTQCRLRDPGVAATAAPFVLLPGVVACVIVAVFNGTGGGCCYNAALALVLHVRRHSVADRVCLCMASPCHVRVTGSWMAMRLQRCPRGCLIITLSLNICLDMKAMNNELGYLPGYWSLI